MSLVVFVGLISMHMLVYSVSMCVCPTPRPTTDNSVRMMDYKSDINHLSEKKTYFGQ